MARRDGSEEAPRTLSDGVEVGWRPSGAELEALRALLAPWKALTDPVFFGLEHVPRDGPVVLVGNHSVFGLLDLPLMIEGIRRERGRFVRGLADHAHFAVPAWRDLLVRLGAVRGTRENCRTLLAAGEAVLVYPGGGREVAKRKGEAYHLIWKQRMGFARMAIEAGCPIVPFGAVGAEDSYDILIDADSAVLAPIRGLVNQVGGRWELVWPIAKGVGLTALPRPERFYFAFGEPLSTTAWAGRHEDQPALRAVRDRTRKLVEGRIAFLLEQREQDPDRDLLARARRRLSI
ncbi:MAG: acyltransferase family protein [Solirubrobacterales bacterium]|nr:acyltransferase family protein [Solirubrobacterales bacterium]